VEWRRERHMSRKVPTIIDNPEEQTVWRLPAQIPSEASHTQVFHWAKMTSPFGPWGWGGGEVEEPEEFLDQPP